MDIRGRNAGKQRPSRYAGIAPHPGRHRLAERVGLGRKEGESSAGLARFSLTESDTRGNLDVVALCVDCAPSAFYRIRECALRKGQFMGLL